MKRRQVTRIVWEGKQTSQSRCLIPLNVDADTKGYYLALEVIEVTQLHDNESADGVIEIRFLNIRNDGAVGADPTMPKTTVHFPKEDDVLDTMFKEFIARNSGVTRVPNAFSVKIEFKLNKKSFCDRALTIVSALSRVLPTADRNWLYNNFRIYQTTEIWHEPFDLGKWVTLEYFYRRTLMND